jgi:hypothetical protein
MVLRHQLNVLQQRAPRRLYLTWIDRALFVWLYRGFPRILDAITILRPEHVIACCFGRIGPSDAAGEFFRTLCLRAGRRSAYPNAAVRYCRRRPAAEK